MWHGVVPPAARVALRSPAVWRLPSAPATQANKPSAQIRMFRPIPSCRAFSLVEVTLSIGVVAFAFVSLMALVPVGLDTFREGMGTTVGAQIAQRVITEAQQTDFDLLIDHVSRADTSQDGLTFRAPSRNDERLRYFDEQGNEVIPKDPDNLSAEEKQKIIYHVNTRVMIRTPRPSDGLGSPAIDLATVTVQVATNPGNLEIPIHISPPAADDVTDPMRNLFKPTTKMSISTWSAMIARNHPPGSLTQ